MKYKIQYKTVVFIEKAVAYYFEEGRSDKETEFHTKHDKVIDDILKKYPRLYYDPLNYYQYACNMFSQFSEEEIQWITSTNSTMAQDNADALWKLLKRSENMPPLFYNLEKLIDKIKIRIEKIMEKGRSILTQRRLRG